MSKAAFFLVVVIVNFGAGSCKKPKHESEINYVQKMVGDHYWHGTVTTYWTNPDTTKDISFNCPVTVINDSTISFEMAYVDIMKRTLYDKNGKTMVFASAQRNPNSSQNDTILYYYESGKMLYHSLISSYGHVTYNQLQTP